MNHFVCTFCVVKLQVLHLELQYGSYIIDNIVHWEKINTFLLHDWQCV